MDTISRVLSRPQAKPYRTSELGTENVQFDEQGLLKFSPVDVENPKEWSRGRKWFITASCVALVTNGSMASSSPSGCLPSISEDLGVSMEVARLTVTLFVLGFCSGPALWAPLSEYYGRRKLYIGCFLGYTAFTFLCAFTPNITGLLIGRFLCGVFIGGAISNTPGIFADLWGPIERNTCMMLFTCSLQMGPSLGPVTSGFYQLKLDWRWNFYQLLWLAGGSLLLLPLIPETLPSRALLTKARRIRKAQAPGYESVRAPLEVEDRSLLEIFKVTLTRPWAILLDPIAAMIAIYMTLVYTLLYMLFTIFPIAFIEIRCWNAGVGELPLLSVCVGSFVAGAYIFWDSLRQRKNIAAGHQHCAEDTLPVAMTGAVAFPIGIFLLGWSGAYASVHWIAPCIGGVIVSFAIAVLFVASLSYLSETYLMYAASAQAGNQIMRSSVAAAAPLFTSQMFAALGMGGGASLIGGFAMVLMPIPLVFYKYGARIRVKSKFAPTQAGLGNKEGDDEAQDTASARILEGEMRSRGDRQEEIEEARSDADSWNDRFNDKDELEQRERSPV
ncbi:Major facilitator superfamily multidrug transporter mdrA [Fulvia fulva]|nr:Major facilitator superfamily multidrug transporter mdrA [Fulvia fulva]WPV15611.1 Major facilitator superfamily multidrug transporter mdrA [Fulvia fulva]WPV30046.1 Major facilitator superfamily multidrug transporter mdrA [Fulvia fulva]